MASAVWGSAPWWGPPPPAPARPLTDIDFCSGAQLQELTQLIEELGVQESWTDGSKSGPDLLQAKDFVFSLLGLVHRRDPRFPPQAELLLLRGGIREGSLDLGPAPLGPYARGPHYDAGFTLLVPVVSVDSTGQELQLDVESCSAWLCLPERIRGTSVREAWQDCLGPPVSRRRDSIHPTESEGCPKDRQRSVGQLHGYGTEPGLHVSLEEQPSNVYGPESPQQHLSDLCFPAPLKNQNGDVTKAAVISPIPQPSEVSGAWPTLCPAQVAAWFFASLAAVAESLSPVPSAPRLVHAARHAGFTTVLLATPGPPRRLLLFDLVPVVSVAGWPEGARSHSWAGPLASETPSFYLVPGGGTERPGASGWQLCFARQELALKARIPAPLLQAHAAAQALLRPLVAGTRTAAPYLLRTLLYWACERLPALYLARTENAGACCLGLLDELGRVLEAGMLPHYFLGGRKLRAGDGAAALLGALARLRGDPAGVLRAAVEEAKAARKGGGLAGVGGGAH
ncbi:transmembrane protein 102 [Manis javanica]|uniref:transmembrane protein 102 n=1 Tax=Manis javanica TaxID=9974 RepID=UPI0008135060|nr:transmembrane protein 102 [Manis javanica]XP_017530684.1 transmembrane protein 102 [Manis javanica]XP_017530685.1 transmembrane protein 102 [Manis javanica]XP_036882993.1 transmembrane protein 102 [Manis javanica]XP_036882994.1 transmembrane protein 102 [Manis javanica]XP_036882995.1 transmembrane protein 102 [Manis javanica]